MERNRRRKKKSGCLGIGIIVGIIAVVVFCILFFATNLFSNSKKKMLSYVYQKQYTEEVEAAAKEFKVDENLIYAVIFTESRFRSDAVSNAGAMGLMQLMPDTFSWLQEKLEGGVIYDDESLFVPEVNIRYGTYYLSYLIDLYDDESTAVAAYNGGTTNVDEWLADPDCSSDGKTLTEIPYSETREYVKKVERAKERYKEIYG